MPVSEKIADIKFTKSVAGYSAKEVDGFLNDVLPLIKDQEQLLMALKVKLEAFEGQRDEIQQREHDSYRVLEAAKKEAEIIVATAKKSAETITSEAQVASEVQNRAASARAGEIIAAAEAKSASLISEAEKNAEKIIRTADEKARAMLEKTKEYTDEEQRKAQALSNECAEFEARFKTLVADTAKSFAAIKEQTPMPAKVIPKEKPKEEVKEAAAPVEEPLPAVDVQETVDIEIVGGRPLVKSQKKEESPRRRLYDTVQVTYDDDDSDFSGIRDIMKRGGERKSPTHFSE